MSNEKLETFEKKKERSSMIRTSEKKFLEIMQTNEQEWTFSFLFFPPEMEKEELLDIVITRMWKQPP